MLLHGLWLILVGFVVGSVGTLVGAGGGFLLIPYLLLVEHLPTSQAVSVSLAVVFFNALSGSIAYWKQGRIDIRSGNRFALSAIPGAIIGTLLTTYMSGETFRIVFSFLLLLVVYKLLGGPMWKTQKIDETQDLSHLQKRVIHDDYGNEYAYTFSQKTGNILSFFVGVYSGLFGIGGGILHVPIMVGVLSFPIHIATATSHYVLSMTSLVSSIESMLMGRMVFKTIAFLGIGVIAGAQVGAAIAPRTNDKLLKYVLSVLLVMTSIKMVLT